MPSFYGTVRKGNQSRLHRLVELIPIEVQVSALASLLLISAFLSGFSWSSSSGSATNLLANPSFKVASSNRSYVLECRGALSCRPSRSAAASWDVSEPDVRVGALWATTDRVPSTLGHGGFWMLHVTGSGGVGIGQAGTFSALDTEWSVWVFPVMGEVKACVGVVGNAPYDTLSCDTTVGLGSWQRLSGTYEGGIEYVTADQFSIEGIATYMSAPTPYTDFYVASASVNVV
jgi:hypothetical protein